MLTDNSGCPLVPTAMMSVGNLAPDGNGVCNNADFRLVNNAGGFVEIKGQGLATEIFVKGKVQLQFEFDRDCVPIGISFEETQRQKSRRKEGRSHGANHNFSDPFGLAAFPHREVVSANGTTILTVYDAHPKNDVCFKFTLVIQIPGIKKPVIIDPKIRNVPM